MYVYSTLLSQSSVTWPPYCTPAICKERARACDNVGNEPKRSREGSVLDKQSATKVINWFLILNWLSTSTTDTRTKNVQFHGVHEIIKQEKIPALIGTNYFSRFVAGDYWFQIFNWFTCWGQRSQLVSSCHSRKPQVSCFKYYTMKQWNSERKKNLANLVVIIPVMNLNNKGSKTCYHGDG